MKRIWLLLLLLLPFSAFAQIRVGADQVDEILKYTHGRRVGMTVNHTSTLSNPTHTHIVDTLISRGVDVVRLFSPEHGLRGTADAGALVKSGADTKTGLRVVSLYGNNYKPSAIDLEGIDLMIFDLQDVGVRFYTYISTLTYVIEACAEQDIDVLVLDRPNPNDYIDGSVRLKTKYRSFVSLLPIPTVHGLTLGEAAKMMNGEGWLKNRAKANLNIITVKGWKHGDPYTLPIAPSPNLQTAQAIKYYPTLCYFEGTSWSEGRGTDAPFEQIGYPNSHLGKHSFVPRAMKGASLPKHQGKKCYGPLLNTYTWSREINLDVILDAYHSSQKYGIKFFTRKSFFNLLAGNGTLYQQIVRGETADDIRASWQHDLAKYRKLRYRYLLYPDCQD